MQPCTAPHPCCHSTVLVLLATWTTVTITDDSAGHLADMIIFFILSKNALFYVKSNILCKWSNILCTYYLTMFTPEHSLLWRFSPSDHQASNPTRPASPTRPDTRIGQLPDPARHQTLPSIPPGQPLHLASHPTLQACLPWKPCLPPQPLQCR